MEYYRTESSNIMAYFIAFGDLTEDNYELIAKEDNPREFYMLIREDHNELYNQYKNDIKIQMFLSAFRNIQNQFVKLRNGKKINGDK